MQQQHRTGESSSVHWSPTTGQHIAPRWSCNLCMGVLCTGALAKCAQLLVVNVQRGAPGQHTALRCHYSRKSPLLHASKLLRRCVRMVVCSVSA
eukprot:1160410-Pelagomonas_calceolata.AAC.3